MRVCGQRHGLLAGRKDLTDLHPETNQITDEKVSNQEGEKTETKPQVCSLSPPEHNCVAS